MVKINRRRSSCKPDVQALATRQHLSATAPPLPNPMIGNICISCLWPSSMCCNFISLLLIKKAISLACTRLLSWENASLLQVLNEIRAGVHGVCLRGEAGSHTRAASDLNRFLFTEIKKRMCCRQSFYIVTSLLGNIKKHKEKGIRMTCYPA